MHLRYEKLDRRNSCDRKLYGELRVEKKYTRTTVNLKLGGLGH